MYFNLKFLFLFLDITRKNTKKVVESTEEIEEEEEEVAEEEEIEEIEEATKEVVKEKMMVTRFFFSTNY